MSHRGLALTTIAWLAASLVGANGRAAPDAPERASVIVVVGAPGTSEYAQTFRSWADRWQSAAGLASADCLRIGQSKPGGPSDRDRLRDALTKEGAKGREPLWLVLIGHGTFDGQAAKFNLEGPDVTDLELSQWLATLSRPLVVLDCTSASGPFLSRLSAPNRVVVTATRSGNEQNYARFGQYLAESIADPRADLDKDGQISLLEAFLAAGSRTRDYYRTHAQLATEHALIDDNGDHLGTPADWFQGVRATRRARDGAALDGIRAHQITLVPSDRERGIPREVRRRRGEIESAIAALRDRKATLAEDAYYAQLEPLMLELARIYRGTAAGPAPPRGSR